MSTAPPEEQAVPGLLPRGWSRALLVIVLFLLGLGYWVGLRAQGPEPDAPGPVEIRAAPPPEPVEDQP